MKRFLLLAITTIVMVGCSNFAEQDALPSKAVGTPDTIYATFDEAEADSRTYVEQGKYLRWNEGDEISFFPVTYNMQYRFKGKTGDNNGAFEKITTDLVTGNELKNNYAVYPYKASTAMSDEGIISFELPAVQHYAENSFGVGANTMVAITSGKDDNILRFKNCGGYLKLQLYGDATVKSIELKGNNGEKIAGASTITAVYGGEPSVAMADSATTSITLDCGDGVALGATADAATAFWFVVPPTTFENGFTVTVTNTEGAIFEKSTSNTTTIDRNTIQPMAEVEVKCANPENCKIYYISTEKIEKSSWSNETFGANIVSNEWDETTGKGVITFDGEVTKIGEASFSYRNSLISITIPDSVTEIGYEAFSGCTSLTSVTIPDSVTSIGRNAFQRCMSLTSVTIGNDVTSIGEYAFQHCTSLKSVIIGTNVSYIGGYAFNYCTSLTSVTIPDSVTSIGYYAFYDCTSLTSITIPDSVTSIGNAAFAGCTKLTSIHITDLSAWCKINFGGNITTYDKRLYLNNVEITELIIPSDVVIINQYSFNNCVGLTKITIHDGVTSIGDMAFNTCKSLTTATIGKNVTYVGKSAFDYCTKLKEIYCKPTTPPAIYYNDYNGDVTGRSFPLDIDIYVPRNSYSAYTQYTSTTEYSIASVQNWYKYNSHIKSYDFE